MKHSRSSLFLMEMIIAILFFSLASAVCIQLFAKSHLLGRQTVNQNHAVTWAQSLADSYLTLDGNLGAVQELFPISSQTSENNLRLSFDSNWDPCSPEDAVTFLADLKSTVADETGIMKAEITLYEISTPETPIYTLSLMHHTAERRGSDE